jgi:Putative periplasmic protein kinase ArgK and related GTPases of G3E family
MKGSDLLEKLLKGEPRVIARAITKVENTSAGSSDLMKAVYPHTGNAAIIGITGSPGAENPRWSINSRFFIRKKAKRSELFALIRQVRFRGARF